MWPIFYFKIPNERPCLYNKVENIKQMNRIGLRHCIKTKTPYPINYSTAGKLIALCRD